MICSTVPVFTQLNNFLCGFLPNLSEKANVETLGPNSHKACLFEALKHGLEHHCPGICETLSRSFEEEETPSDASTTDDRHKQRQDLVARRSMRTTHVLCITMPYYATMSMQSMQWISVDSGTDAMQPVVASTK